MTLRSLGRTGIKVSTLCLGGDNFLNPTSEEESIRMIDAALAKKAAEKAAQEAAAKAAADAQAAAQAAAQTTTTTPATLRSEQIVDTFTLPTSDVPPSVDGMSTNILG